MSKKSTSDIYFSAALLSLGAKLEHTDKDDPRHMVFEFSLEDVVDPIKEPVKSALTVNKNMDSWETQWANKSLMVNAFEFAEALKRLKSVVHTRY